MPRKAQIAYEFLVLFFFLTVLFTFWFIVAAGAREQLQNDQINLQLQDLGLSVQDDLYTALSMPNGFSRNITLPALIGTQEYDIRIENNDGQQYVILNTSGQSADFNVPPITVHYQPKKLPETNTITKYDGRLHLNED